MIKSRRKHTQTIDWVFIGDGPREDVAYNYALLHPNKSIVVIEPQAPLYEIPANMKYIQMGALSWLESRAAESVRNVREDFSFVSVTMEAPCSDPVKQFQRQIKVYEAIRDSLKGVNPLPKGIPNLNKNSLRFCKLVNKALIPGGNFYLTDEKRYLESIEDYLLKAGFDLEFQELSEEQIRDESHQARYDNGFGNRIVRAIATKPNSKSDGVSQGQDADTKLARRRNLLEGIVI